MEAYAVTMNACGSWHTSVTVENRPRSVSSEALVILHRENFKRDPHLEDVVGHLEHGSAIEDLNVDNMIDRQSQISNEGRVRSMRGKSWVWECGAPTFRERNSRRRSTYSQPFMTTTRKMSMKRIA